ncbi:MAG: pre-16S rRNA-processing nuclease YqgF [Chitinophagaceae bacterium]|nr:pre-16S rRNA-processing nuclease YqgF [Chitinophagaceae bacterium]
MGIDYGSKRVGIAISDENAQFAIPNVVISNNKKLLSEVLNICKTNDISEIVLGESKDYKMNDNPIMKEISEFKLNLEREKIKVHLELEYMTSAQATFFQKENKMIDASAAAIILQSYLDRKNMGYNKLA